MNTLLSFIIPAYNCEKYIKACIESILKIKSNFFEIIVVNDGSTDNTQTIIDEFKNHKQISIIVQNNSGVSSARNSGLKVAKGKYVAFIDSDDLIFSDWYTKNIHLLECHNEDIIFFDYCKYNKGISKIKKRSNLKEGCDNIDSAYQAILDGSFNNVWDNLYLKQIIDLNNIKFREDMKLGEDVFFNIDFVNHSKNIYYYSEPIYCYNIDNSTSAMHKYKVDHIKDYCELFDGYQKLINDHQGIIFSVGLRHYVSRLFGSLYYGERIINNDEYSQLINSFFYKTIMNSNKNFGVSDYIKKLLISSKLYKNQTTRKIIATMTKFSA